jgi:hypothetical protein
LYDPFDASVEWELAVPLFDGERITAVLNLEGTGSFSLDGSIWRKFAEVLFSTTGWCLPMTVPRAGEAWMVRSEHVQILSKGRPEAAEALARLGGPAANEGSCVVIVGDLELPVSHVYPTLEQAIAAGLPLGGCVRGGGSKLDLLPTGSAASAESTAWWTIVDGRYDLVLHVVDEDAGGEKR